MEAHSNQFSRRGFVKSVAAGTALSSGIAPSPIFGQSGDPASQSRVLTSSQPVDVRRYPIYRAEGTHRELGRQHGEQAKEHILAHLDLLRVKTKLSDEKLKSRAMQFQPLFKKYCPHLIDEIKGLGEGCGISYAEALATNIRGGLNSTMDGACTTYAISGRGTVDGEILSGQNADISLTEIDLAYVLHLKPKNKPQILIWTFGGMIGYHGMNSSGIGAFANALGGGPGPKYGMTHYPAKRLILECSNLDEVEQVTKRVPLASNGNYMLNDRKKILNIEWTTDGPKRIIDEGRGFLAHTNHFVCSEYATPENYARSLKDSFPRLERMNQLIQSRFGKLGVKDLKSFLKDSDNSPHGICRSDVKNSSITTASIISEPAKRQMHVAVGYEQGTPFELYQMDD
ncbi:MAG: hypothetical protein GXP30_01450 [Verrucomicrobia bacterium]|nr:hypothetical protein [Verrucomicrobiota bacterium]